MKCDHTETEIDVRGNQVAVHTRIEKGMVRAMDDKDMLDHGER